jgi:hypothetical protein
MIPKNALYMKVEAIDAIDVSIWICLDEVRDIFGLQDDEGQKGEWLACGFIPSSMIAAQVILQDYEIRPDMAQTVHKGSSVMSRSGSVGSIKSISSKEQEEHIRVQILRNRASREDLRRAKAASKRPNHIRGQTVLRQAINNNQVSIVRNIWFKHTNADKITSGKDKKSEVPRQPSNTRAAHVEPRDEAASLVSNADLIERLAGPSLYASIRSPILREALERKKPSISTENVFSIKGTRLPESQKTTERCEDSDLEDQLRGLSLVGDCVDHPESRDSEVESLAQETDDSDLLPHSERLRRARAGKRKADFYTLGQNPRLELGVTIEAESESKSDTESIMGSTLDLIITILDELGRRRERRKRSAAPVPSLWNEGEIRPGYSSCSVDEETSTAEEVFGYEADISDSYSSVLGCTPLRRTRRSAHSRLTTPLGLYKPGHKPTRG